MTRPKTLTPLARVVEADETLKSWNDRRRREDTLLRAIRRLLPRPVAERLYVTDGQSSTLELATGAGAIASVVRQRGPEILAALNRDGWQFSGIRVRVQPPSMPLSLQKVEPRQWDSQSRRPLVALEAELCAGPLKAALRHFLKSR